jgi:hypothetical protein
MSITFVHGDNQVESRDKLQELKSEAREKDFEILSIDGNNNIAITDVIQSIEAGSLFSAAGKLVVIENLLSSRKNNINIWDYLKAEEFDVDLVLWEPKKIDGRKLLWIKKRKRGKVEEFAYPKLMFKFLESIGTHLKENTLSLFNELVKTQPVELVYYMIVRQLRMLLLVKSDSKDAGVKETKRLQNWQITRLKQQSANISLKELKNYYRTLMYIDYQQKTGRAALNLKQTLDIFLTTL